MFLLNLWGEIPAVEILEIMKESKKAAISDKWNHYIMHQMVKVNLENVCALVVSCAISSLMCNSIECNYDFVLTYKQH